MGLEFNNLAKVNIDKRIITAVFNRFLKINKLPKSAKASVALVDKQTIKKLNNLYRGMNQATDVLSFSEREAEKFPGDEDLGEVIICYSSALKQAREHGHSVIKEIKILLAHGLVHLLGYDHRTKKEAKAMMELEKKILSKDP